MEKLMFERIKARAVEGAEGGLTRLHRAKIPGGWLVVSNGGHPCFVPDPNHEWDGSSLP